MGTIQTPEINKERHIHLLGQWGGILLFSFMTFRQIYYYYPGFEEPLVFLKWFLVTFLFLQFLVAYISRTQAKARADKIADFLLPFFCAGLPFLIIMGPRWLQPFVTGKDYVAIWNFWITILYPPQEVLGLSIMAFGEVITIWGMFGLKGSFSIATEVRVLRTTGPYRFVRHPLYTGEMISLVGWTLHWCNWFSVLGTSLFLIFQTWRAKREECKISEIYPEYQEYKKQVGFLWPKLWRNKSKA